MKRITIDPMQLVVRTGKKIGILHLEDDIPCQDNVVPVQTKDYVLLVISDGSTGAGYEGELEIRTEIGSHFFVNWIKEFVARQEEDQPAFFDQFWSVKEAQEAAEWYFGLMFETIIHKIRDVAATFSDNPYIQSQYIDTIFAATIRGILITKYWTIKFEIGDGIDQIGENITETNQYGIPQYPGYAALPYGFAPDLVDVGKEEMWDPTPKGFSVTVMPHSKLGKQQWLVASDGAKGFIHNSNVKLTTADPDGDWPDTIGTFQQFFGSPMVEQVPFAIDLRLNILIENNRALLKHIFDDDISIALAFMPKQLTMVTTMDSFMTMVKPPSQPEDDETEYSDDPEDSSE